MRPASYQPGNAGQSGLRRRKHCDDRSAAMSAPWWRPDRLAARRAKLAARGRVLRAVRDFFDDRRLCRGRDAGVAGRARGSNRICRPSRPCLHDPRDGGARPRYLHTSPEFAMKKLLAGGMERIWQLAHVYRDGERGATHHPEFAMLEWYRAGASYRDLMEECEALLRAAQKAAGADALRWRGHRADAGLPWQRLTVAEAFSRVFRHRPAGDRARSACARTPRCSPPRRARIGIAPHHGDDWETLFFRIFLERIEPHLGIGAPTILYDYPVSMAALSRRKPDDPRLAERFELYVCGLELANAFGELTDPAEQRAPLSGGPGAQAGALRRDLSDRRGFPRGARIRTARLRRHRARLRPARHARDRGRPHRGGAVGAGDVIRSEAGM